MEWICKLQPRQTRTTYLHLVRHIRHRERVGHILLVGKDQDDGVVHFLLAKQRMEFLLGFIYTFSIVGIDDKNEA